MPMASQQELREHLAGGGFTEGNRLIEAMESMMESPLPTPPSALSYRVAHTTVAIDFLLSGLVSRFDFMPLLKRYDSAPERRLLDWGCGCGRLSLHIAHAHPEIHLTGCDIDAEAVQWCNDSIHQGRFHRIDPMPPTRFGAGEFTSIIGYSVVTHLPRGHQLAWIAELWRLLRRGGVIVLTTMGRPAAARHGLAERLDSVGIIDEWLDTTLDGVAPPGYYRSTFQSRAFTEKAWGSRFEVLEYQEAAAFNYQDIVVLRRPT